jgi:aspartate racemase
VKTIGIVGGVGPFAGLDLNTKIFAQTIAQQDQDHLEVYLLSRSAAIPDRTGFLSGNTTENPAGQIVETIKKLASIGAQVIGIPCNTSHSPRIFEAITRDINKLPIKLLHMIEEVGSYISKKYPDKKKCGLLATLGTYNSGIYAQCLALKGLEVVLPSKETQASVHDAIYNAQYGIKAVSQPVSSQAKAQLDKAMAELRANGAELIILGCTELSLLYAHGQGLIDSNTILARALVCESAPERLVPEV